MAVTITKCLAKKAQKPAAPKPPKTPKPKKAQPTKRERIAEAVTTQPPVSSKKRPTNLASKYKRIYDLGDERRGIVNSMFIEGKPVTAIIHLMKEGWELFRDVSDAALSKYLYRYKWEVLDKEIVVASEMIQEPRKATLLSELATQIDVAQEVANLVVLQKSRVTKLYNREKDMPMLFNSLGGELKTLSVLLQQYADLSFDLGLMKKVPQLTKITDSKGHTTLVESAGRDQVMFHVENSQQVASAAAEFFRVLEGDITDVEVEDAPTA